MNDIKIDYQRKYEENFKILKFLYRLYFDLSLRVVVNYRIQYYCINTKSKIFRFIAYSYKKRNQKKYGIEIGLKTKIGTGFVIRHTEGIVIGDGVVIDSNCTIYQGVTIGQNNGKYPKIGKNCTVYPQSIVIGGIYICDNVIIGAKSLVRLSILNSGIYAGNPIKKIERRKMNG